MDISRKHFLAIIIQLTTAGCLERIRNKTSDVETEAVSDYKNGRKAFDKAEKVWERAIISYNIDNWAQASQQFRYAQNQYIQSKKSFESITNKQLPDKAIRYADQSIKHVKVMSEAAKYYSESASGYLLVNSQQVDDNYQRALEYQEMAQSIPPPVTVVVFRSALQ